MRILLLSAYHAESHRRWCEGLISAFDDCQWTLLTLPPRYFSWRVRGNSLSWAFQQREVLEQEYDLLIATSMVDLSSLRGFVPKLAQLPTIVYFHENQFAYPLSKQAQQTVEPQVLNIYTALCADRLLFNSEFNRSSFLAGCADLLRRLPDHVPEGISELLRTRSEILPVPIANSGFRTTHNKGVDLWQGRSGDGQILKLLWAARHEYDKGPDRLLAILTQLEKRSVPYKIAILGQQFQSSPEEFKLIHQQFKHRIVQFGFVESSLEHRQWLQTADIILSTAIHEFQGLAVLEAIAEGCIPILPDRQVYPELVSESYLYNSYQTDIETEARSAVELILSASEQVAPDVSGFSWASLKPRYRDILQQTAGATIPC